MASVLPMGIRRTFATYFRGDPRHNSVSPCVYGGGWVRHATRRQPRPTLIPPLFAVARPHLLQPAETESGVSWRGLGVFAALSAVALAQRAANGDLFPFLALGMIFGGATYWALLDRSVLSAPLRAGFFYPISRLSYSMYLNHWWIWPSSNKAIVEGVQAFVSNPTAVFLISMLIGTALSFVLAAVMFILVEHPFLLLRDRVLTSTRKAHTQSAPATSAHA